MKSVFLCAAFFCASAMAKNVSITQETSDANYMLIFYNDSACTSPLTHLRTGNYTGHPTWLHPGNPTVQNGVVIFIRNDTYLELQKKSGMETYLHVVIYFREAQEPHEWVDHGAVFLPWIEAACTHLNETGMGVDYLPPGEFHKASHFVLLNIGAKKMSQMA